MHFIEAEKTIEHPMESVLDIEPGTTVVQYTQPVEDEQVVGEAYDEKDIAIDKKFNDIYRMAIASVTDLRDEIERVEGKYKRGLAENAVQMLNVALSAATQEGHYKIQKTKAIVSQGDTTNNVTNNVIVADRNQVLKMLRDSQNTQN